MKTDGFYLPEPDCGEQKENDDHYDYSIFTLAGMIIIGTIVFGCVAIAVMAFINAIFNLIFPNI